MIRGALSMSSSIDGDCACGTGCGSVPPGTHTVMAKMAAAPRPDAIRTAATFLPALAPAAAAT